jgi:hypothetical protein
VPIRFQAHKRKSGNDRRKMAIDLRIMETLAAYPYQNAARFANAMTNRAVVSIAVGCIGVLLMTMLLSSLKSANSGQSLAEIACPVAHKLPTRLKPVFINEQKDKSLQDEVARFNQMLQLPYFSLGKCCLQYQCAKPGSNRNSRKQGVSRMG